MQLAAAHGDAQWWHMQVAFHAAFEVEAQGEGAGAGWQERLQWGGGQRAEAARPPVV